MHFLAKFLGRVRPQDETIWHPWYAIWPVKTVSGDWVVREVLRRKIDGRVEYQENNDDDISQRIKEW